MKAIGIDIGSSSVKGAVLDLTKSIVEPDLSRPFPSPISGMPTGWIEVDPQAVHNSVLELLSTLWQLAPDAERVLFSGQMGGLILLDESGRPLSNYVSWRDQRSLAKVAEKQTTFEQVRTAWEDAGCFADLGRELQAGSTTVLLAWLNSRGQLPPNAIPYTIADYVIAKLIGQQPKFHVTQAIGMLDLGNNEWHRPAWEALGLGHLQLPQLARNEACVGEFKSHGRTIQVFGSYGDQPCALRGANLQRDELSINLSTGGQVSCRMDKFEPGNYQSRKYFFGDTLNTITHLPAGRSLNVLFDLVTELARAQGNSPTDHWSTINRLIEEVESTDLSVTPTFFRGPLGTQGRIENISTENLSVGTLFNATLRWISDQIAEVAQRLSPATTRLNVPMQASKMEPVTKRSWNSIVLSGGLTHKLPRLRSLLREGFSAPFRESPGEETLAGLLDIAKHNL